MATVLIVEDDPVLRSMITRTFDLAGHDTLALESLEAATEALEVFTPDLVVCDVNLPDGSGLELACRIRERSDRRTVVVLSSGFRVPPEQVEASGADTFVEKPFLFTDLLVRCEELLPSRTAAQPHAGT